MLDFWLNFQSEAGEIASKIFSSISMKKLLTLSLISALLGVIFVYIYSFISFQSALSSLKKKIFAVALEPFLFRDNLFLSISSPVRVFVLGLKYLALCLPPLVILALPMLWILGFLNQAYGYRDLVPGDKVFVSVSTESAREIRSLELDSKLEGAELSTVVKSPVQNRAYAELRVMSQNPSGSLQLKTQKETLDIPLFRSEFIIPVISTIAWKKLIYPGARFSLPTGINEIEFEYPVRHFELFSSPFAFEIHWLIFFCIVSVISGLIFAKIAGVEV